MIIHSYLSDASMHFFIMGIIEFTPPGSFEINKKTLRTDDKIQGYYDDGSSFYSSSMEYNLDTGIAKSEEEIVMFGKWGNIKSKKFSFNSIKDIYRFEDKAVMIVK